MIKFSKEKWALKSDDELIIQMTYAAIVFVQIFVFNDKIWISNIFNDRFCLEIIVKTNK